MFDTRRLEPVGSARRLGLVSAVALAVVALGGAALAQTQPQPAQPRPAQPAAPRPAQPRPAQQPAQPAQQQQAAPQQSEQQPAAQQAPAISTPWTKVCNTDPQVNREICLISQEIRAETGQFLASVAVREVQNDPKKTFIIAVPIGMLLQPGVRVVIDQQPPISAKYAICFPNACYADMEINADQITKMKRGQQLMVQTLNQSGRTVSFTMALSGFGKAYDGPALDPKVVEDQQKKLQDEMQKRADELRKKLQEQGQAGAAPAAPAAPR